jgi:indolepyruvate ferredoxin oxidoreductase
LAQAVAIASIPEDIRGYGHVKERHLTAAKEKEASLLIAFNAPIAVPVAAPAPLAATVA